MKIPSFSIALLLALVHQGNTIIKLDKTALRVKREVRSRSELCEGKEDNVLHPDPADCSRYILCTGAYEYIAKCPPTLFYDPDLEACNYDEDGLCEAQMRRINGFPQTTRGFDPNLGRQENTVPQSASSSSSSSSTIWVTKEFFCENRPDGTYSDPVECSKYILCSNGVSHVRECPTGLMYREDTNGCDFDHEGRCKKGIAGPGIPGSSFRPPAATLPPSGSNIQPGPQDVFSQAQLIMPGAMERAMNNLMDRLKGESEMAMGATGRDRPFKLVQGLQRGKPVVKQMSNNAFILENVTQDVMEKLGMAKNKAGVEQMRNILSPLTPNTMRLNADDPIPKSEPGACPFPSYTCQVMKYRTFDGSCNNLQNPLWGRSFIPLKRNLDADYADGLEALRRAKDGSDLPSPRLVSFNTLPDKDVPHHIHTVMVMQWGQFIDHDITLTAITKLRKDPDGMGVPVDIECGSDGCSRDAHPACNPIPIPDNDPDFRTKKCLEFVRSEAVPNIDCKIGPREQLNQITSYMDASMIYGSTKEESEKLRDRTQPSRGRLLSSPNPNNPTLKKMLPKSEDDDMCLERQSTCFTAGDERVNEQTALTALHVIWLREHNRIEEQLHAQRPEWDGETLYQETRKIIGALMQQITYGEFLPVVLGPVIMRKYDIFLQDEGFHTGYDAGVDASASTEFATAAFRFGHSMLTPMFKRLDIDYKTLSQISLSEMFFKPSRLMDAGSDGIDGFLRGICNSRIQTVDKFLTKEVTRSLFSDNPPSGLGTDLASLNIQRSRDHGIPGYNAYRAWCGIRKATSFDDLTDIDPQSRTKFRELYRSVDDIDLFPGGLAETPAEGSLLGPTFSCLLAREFARIKKGDRYWYENQGQFSQSQLKEIRKLKLAKVICNNGDNIKRVQPAVMQMPFREAYPNKDLFNTPRDGLDVEWLLQLWNDNYNRREECDCLPDIDFTAWRNA